MLVRKLDSCCCCIDLKTGVLVIGIISIVFDIGALIQAPIAYTQACSGFRTPENNLECAGANMRLGVSISSAVFGSILMALMIYGSQTENYTIMMLIAILQAVGIVIGTCIIWYLSIILLAFSLGHGILMLVIGNIAIAVSIYLWLVISSRCQEIKDASYKSPIIA
ncbi:uncharacterized protein LOC130674348 isoform X1 [Microplitis mediator]|uniref:uncharacterized protein LOC130674348 isoform X1 n=1 Tax=Microplitis mediator TaxID=375433 RepID=UPI002557238D|nr:uncharacterized protein LOC130674348 isoform X1 [Microplitis mediator]